MTDEADEFIADARALAQIDGPAILRAIEAIPPDQYFSTAADVVGWVEKFVPIPPLEITVASLRLLAFIAKGYETGAIKSADPQDPSMQHAAGNGNFTS